MPKWMRKAHRQRRCLPHSLRKHQLPLRAKREVLAAFPEAEIVQPANLEDFKAVLAEKAPGLVLTDLDLRWTIGHQVLLTVKSRYPACPVVMFTGTGDETIAVELMKEGLDDYVVKSPRQLSRLRTSIKLTVEMAKSREQLSDREARLARALAQQQVVVARAASSREE